MLGTRLGHAVVSSGSCQGRTPLSSGITAPLKSAYERLDLAALDLSESLFLLGLGLEVGDPLESLRRRDAELDESACLHVVCHLQPSRVWSRYRYSIQRCQTGHFLQRRAFSTRIG